MRQPRRQGGMNVEMLPRASSRRPSSGSADRDHDGARRDQPGRAHEPPELGGGATRRRGAATAARPARRGKRAESIAMKLAMVTLALIVTISAASGVAADPSDEARAVYRQFAAAQNARDLDRVRS